MEEAMVTAARTEERYRMGVVRSTLFWGGGAAAVTLFRLWGRLWLLGVVAGFWIVFSLKYLLRGVAGRRRAGSNQYLSD